MDKNISDSNVSFEYNLFDNSVYAFIKSWANTANIDLTDLKMPTLFIAQTVMTKIRYLMNDDVYGGQILAVPAYDRIIVIFNRRIESQDNKRYLEALFHAVITGVSEEIILSKQHAESKFMYSFTYARTALYKTDIILDRNLVEFMTC